MTNDVFFDTIKVSPKDGIQSIKDRANELEINLRYFEDGTVRVSFNYLNV